MAQAFFLHHLPLSSVFLFSTSLPATPHSDSIRCRTTWRLCWVHFNKPHLLPPLSLQESMKSWSQRVSRKGWTIPLFEVTCRWSGRIGDHVWWGRLSEMIFLCSHYLRSHKTSTDQLKLTGDSMGLQHHRVRIGVHGKWWNNWGSRGDFYRNDGTWKATEVVENDFESRKEIWKAQPVHPTIFIPSSIDGIPPK